jgi:hypothetical protein
VAGIAAGLAREGLGDRCAPGLAGQHASHVVAVKCGDVWVMLIGPAPCPARLPDPPPLLPALAARMPPAKSGDSTEAAGARGIFQPLVPSANAAGGATCAAKFVANV